MNRIETNFNLGFDLVLEDYRFQDAAVRLAFADLAKALGSTGPVILWGCNVTYAGTTATVTEGAIFYNNEIWHVYPHTFLVNDPLSGEPKWCFVVSYDPEGAKLDSELNPHNTYELRKAVGGLLSLPFPADVVNMSDTPRVGFNYSTAVLPVESGVTSLGEGSVVIKTGYLAMLEVSLQVNLASGTSIHVATVPEGMRPGRTIRGICLMRGATSTGKVLAAWSIASDGQVYVEKLGEETGTWNFYFSTELYRINN